MSYRELKDPLYEQFARIGHAAASPKRIELLDLLSQGPKTVEVLAAESATPVKNTSAHLRVLREARLVETRRVGTHVHYRLADDTVFGFLRALKALAHRRLAEVEQVTSLYLTRRDEMEPVSLAELRRLIRDGSVTVLDVRPRAEYDAGHIPGALSVPLAELEKRLDEIPRESEVIAYCRGPYCVFSVEAVGVLRRRGYRARRADEGLPEWRAEGWPVAARREA
jgi:rhodanese-related sulfurtransferase